MRDIDLSTDTDLAYASPGPAGVPDDTTVVDPAFTDAKAYVFPSLGGDFGPARANILGAQADGGAALLAADPVVTYADKPPPLAPIIWPGRAANATTRLNLYPWFKTPKEGLDQNNPNPPPVAADPPTGVTVSGNTLVGNQGNASFSGPAARNAIVTLDYSLDGGATQQVTINILAGDTGSQIAAKARAAIDAVFGLDASGTGGTLNVVGLGGVLTAFHISVS